ncbi:hypothetical protein [Providencia sp. 2024EL-00732]|uniref:hypothetical protein n=1 Tax=Providencia sp. 2024EL-00732 TaxID=3374242 RepID=UPI00375694B4
MWINEYMNEITAFFGALGVVFALLFGAVNMAYGSYFITLKNNFLNGLVNFSILCVFLSVVFLFIYLLSYSFYNSEVISFKIYFLSVIFYMWILMFILCLLYCFFSWVGGASDL